MKAARTVRPGGRWKRTHSTGHLASGLPELLHSRSRGEHFTIRVQRYSDHVRVECQDAGGPWRGKHQNDDRPHGLSVVEALTGGPADWGVQVTGDGRIVWARITW